MSIFFTMMKKSKESYAHYYSKEILMSWFKKKYDSKKTTSNFYIFDWDTEFRDPDRGIRLEYPIISREIKKSELTIKEYIGMDPAWPRNQYPDLEKVLKNGRQIEAIIDLVVISNGKVKYGLEVVHKHPCSVSKLLFLREMKKKYGFSVYEISAEWIMNQLWHRN